MARQPSLGEILADDTGQIRPEVADLLMEPVRPRPHRAARVRHQAVPNPVAQDQRRHHRSGWIFWGMPILAALLILGILSDRKPKGRTPDHARDFYKPGATPAASPPSRTNEPQMKKGQVFGDSVRIREEPNPQGRIIGIVDQGKTLNVVSFSNGWYCVVLDEGESGYVFGAYLLPIDFQPGPYCVGLLEDRTKILVRVDVYPDYYQMILPDGQARAVRKEDVVLVR